MFAEVDLHIHSKYSSDGDLSPLEIISLSQEHGLRAISIADHDSVAAYPEAIEIAQGLSVEVIPSVELTTLYDSREFHLLLPFAQWDHPLLLEFIRKVHEARIIEAKERIAKLQLLGFEITWEEAIKGNSSPPLGVVIAKKLLEKNSSRNDSRLTKYFEARNIRLAPYLFYEDYFRPGRPAYVPKRMVSIFEVLNRASEFGAAPVLAHPGADFELATFDDLKKLKDNGLIGLEVFSTYHNEKMTAFYLEIAQELDLVPTAGSDFHGRIKPHVAFGCVREGRYSMVESLRQKIKRR
ncbi:MAG: PHP domain-containing protein [Candidatus Aminicenantes bacterium]|nr:PHP domain-containing protein [Candidatus Aminicenantes bacterium]